MNNINIVCLLIVFFMISSCFNNEKRNLEKGKSIMYKEVNIEKIINRMQVMPFKNDSLMENYLSEKLTEIGADTIAEIGKDTVIIPRFLVHNYGDIFKNNHKYLIVYEQSMMRTGYIWFLKTKNGFIKFYERDSDGIEGALYIKDSIFDTNKDGIYELVAYKRRGGSGPNYKIIYFLNSDGLIIKELQENLEEKPFLNH